MRSPGYVGYEKVPAFRSSAPEAVFVVLFDEIEKAHRRVNVLRSARRRPHHDGRRTVDFKNRSSSDFQHRLAIHHGGESPSAPSMVMTHCGAFST